MIFIICKKCYLLYVTNFSPNKFKTFINYGNNFGGDKRYYEYIK